MFALVQLLTQICLFRRGPEDLPSSQVLLAFLLIVNVLLSVTLNTTVQGSTILSAATLVVASLAGTAGLVWLLLNFTNYGARFMQTFTALVGVDVLLTIVTAVIALFTLQDDGPVTGIGNFALMAVLIWNLSVYATIFQRALEVHAAIGLGLALMVVIFSVAIGQIAVAN